MLVVAAGDHVSRVGSESVGHMPLVADALDLHPDRPAVYLDQWVWVRLAKADLGEPREPSDAALLAAVREASAGGVLFPLSATHYMETSKITSPRQRGDLARTMASVSRCRTLRSRRVLLRHQMLHAMHLAFGRRLSGPKRRRSSGRESCGPSPVNWRRSCCAGLTGRSTRRASRE